MANGRCANIEASAQQPAVERDEQLALLQRLVLDIRDSIYRSRALVCSTRDAIELALQLQTRELSN
jgi:hypothetical protein